MRSVWLLTRLQVMQAVGGLRAAVEKRTGARGAMALTALVAVALFGGVAWLGFAAHGLLSPLGLERQLLDLLFLSTGVLTFMFAVPMVLSSFFASSDTADLLPLPVSELAVAFSKAAGVLVSSYPWTFLLLAGPLLGWGIAAGAGVSYWAAYLVAVLVAPLMPCAYAGTLALLIAAVFRRVRRKDAITTLTTMLALSLSLALFFVFQGLSAAPGVGSMVSALAERMGGMVMAFPAYGFAVYALQHSDPLGIALLALLSLAAFAVFVGVARGLYLRIVTSLSAGGADAAVYAGGAQEQAPVLRSLVRVEARKIARNSSILVNYVVYPALMVPLVMGGTLMSGNIGNVLSNLVAEFGVHGLLVSISFAFFMLLASFGTMGNRIAATAVSREGSNWTHLKYLPVPLETQVRAKVLPGFCVSAAIGSVVMVAGSVMLVVHAGLGAVEVVSALLLELASCWLVSCADMWGGSRRPRVDWGNDGDVNEKVIRGSGGILRSLVINLVYALLPVGSFLALDALGSLSAQLAASLTMPVAAVVGVVVALVASRGLIRAAARNIAAME